MELYRSDEGFEIDHPTDWRLTEGVLGASVVLSAPVSAGDDFAENVNVLVETVPSTTDTAAYTEATLEALERFITDFDLIEQGEARLGGQSGYEVHYRGRTGVVDLEWQQIWTVEGTSAYVLTYTAEPTDFSVHVREADAIFASFDLT